MQHPFDTIKQKTTELGFDAFGVYAPQLPESTSAGLDEYLAAGHHGDMEWMKTRHDMRRSPAAIWPEATSVIVIGHSYAPLQNPLEKLKHPHIGNISAYALGDDYHEVMKKKLKELCGWLVEQYGCEAKCFVDTAPVMEKPLAELAGIGWQGKHTCLISREHGNWLFLGVVFTTIPLDNFQHMRQLRNNEDSPSRLRDEDEIHPPRLRGGLGGGSIHTKNSDTHDEPAPPSGSAAASFPPASGVDNVSAREVDYSARTSGVGNIGSCGTCTRCIDICPTQAIIAPHQLDARKCIAYLTIEHKGHIPVQYRKAIGNRIYGCDDCLAICPWNKFASASKEAKYQARSALNTPPLAELATLDDAGFRTLFSKSPIKRTGRNRFIRNVCIAIGNTGDPRYLAQLTTLTSDESELVREAARWAVNEINVKA